MTDLAITRGASTIDRQERGNKNSQKMSKDQFHVLEKEISLISTKDRLIAITILPLDGSHDELQLLWTKLGADWPNATVL